ncbi:hypothetical protein E9993_15945 [Labilibacter sediminis]|nr:hypothetical protein E9993_15945 [Labilibacter sediminis]
MKNTIVCILLLFTIVGHSQKRCKTVKRSLNSIHKEIYQVEKRSKQKNGFYYILDKITKDTLVIGNYNQDCRVGDWKYFKDKETLYLEYDFDNNELKFYDNNSEIDSTYINKNNKYIFDKVDNPQLYIGFVNEALSELATVLRVPVDMIESGKTGICIYSFVIDTNGILNDIKVEQSINKELDFFVFEAIKGLKNKWIPAKKGGQAFSSKTTLTVQIANNSDILINDLNTPYSWHLVLMYYGQN